LLLMYNYQFFIIMEDSNLCIEGCSARANDDISKL
jgi:hypothetical protein